MKKSNGITIISLVITIIVMLILVAVTVTIVVNGGLFEYAGKARRETQNAIDKEQEKASGRMNVGGKLYDSPEDFANGIEASI